MAGASTKSRALRALLPVLVGSALAGGCERGAARVERAPEPLEVQHSGCERELVGPVCELAPSSVVTLWSERPLDALELRVGAERLRPAALPVAGGYQVRVTPPPGAAELSLWQAGARRWRLALAPYSLSPLLERARAAQARADLALAAEQVELARRDGTALDLALAEGIVARLELRRGEAAAAGAILERTSGRLLELGQLSEASRDVFARLFILLQRQHEIAEAERWLGRWREPMSGFPLGRALLADHEGMLRATLGEPVQALRAYRDAERRYERLGEAAHARRVRKEQVGLLADIGQVEAAWRRQATLLPPPEEEPACARAQLYILQSWLTFLLAEDGHDERARELGPLLGVSEQWEQRCGDPEVIVTGLVNRGLWALRQGDRTQLSRLEAQLRALPPRRGPELRAWTTELEARAALAGGRLAEARALFESERSIGRSAGRIDPELRGWVGLAAVADARGSAAEADAHLRAALEALGRARRWEAFGSLVYSQFASRQRAAQRLVARLLARGASAEAYRVALSAHRAALGVQARSPSPERWAPGARESWLGLLGDYRRRRQRLDAEAEDDWRLSSAELKVAAARRQQEREQLEALLQGAAELAQEPAAQELPRPAAGELWLLLLPLDAAGSSGWAVFADDGRVVRSAQRPPAAVEAAAAGDHPLLEPFAAAIAGAERVVLLPSGRARRLPLETWRAGGQPLGDRPLAFGAALGAAARAAPGPARRVGVSADPRGDLPFARREAQRIAELLGLPGGRALIGEQVTGSALLEQLETSDLFHFAGHAREGSGGHPALLLASGAELEPWELAGSSSVPREVVLSACDAGGSPEDFGVGWGLAQAFLALGAERVLAPVRAVGDQAAYELQLALYRRLAGGQTLPEAFWAARRASGAEVASFRLFVR